ncbi:hypothetical protein SAMN02927903_01468 [Flavobacterium caeni]|uniref:Uncharacterized protein n=2 Tax=Flavobacterium caeni TaxID=490189 RepID=A0A1G5G7A3_9FLAO|nr:hypothetical protein SAMN02927903_01468 [Flavobacterium caeni]
MSMCSWTLKTRAMVKVIVSLAAAASTVFGQIVEAEVKPKPEPIKKELLNPVPTDKPAAKTCRHDSKLA